MNIKQAKKRIIELKNKLNIWSEEYYTFDKPSVSDFEYDKKIQELILIESQFPSLEKKDSPTQKVGGKILAKFSKVSHNYPMLSLANAFNKDDLFKFDQQIKDKLKSQLEIEYEVSLKIDGLSISLIYDHGQLQKAITRGDGIIGEDVSHNVLTIKDIPHFINFQNHLEVRGEVYMSKGEFERLNSLGNNFANPRNAAAGTLRQLNLQIVNSRKLNTFLYNIPNPLDYNLTTQEAVLNFIKSQKLTINPVGNIFTGISEIYNFILLMIEKKTQLDYEIDGIVLKVNDNNLYQKIGYTAKAPKYMIAYKFPEEIKSTTLLAIFPTVGRTGRITYNAKLKPLNLAGSVVSAATLHNSDYIRNIKININDEVFVKKAGEIIPRVLGVKIKHNTKKWFETKNCPACNSSLVRSEAEVDQYCLNRYCEGQILARIDHFASRNAMNIEGLASEIIKTLYHKKLLWDILSIYSLKDREKDFEKIFGFKEKSINNLLKSIEKSKATTLDKFLFGLGIRHIGSKTAKVIANVFGTIENIRKASIEKIIAIKDLGPKSANSLFNFFSDPDHNLMIDMFLNSGITFKTPQIISNKLFANKTFVITGTLSKGRNYFKELIENNSGNVLATISSKTDYLLAGKNAGSKLKKAQIIGVKILNEVEFIKIVGGKENG